MKLIQNIAAVVALAAAVQAQSTVTVTGTISYADRNFTYAGMPTATVNRPVRFADFDLVTNTGTILPLTSGNAFTGANGAFSVTISIATNTSFTVVARSTTARAFLAGACPISASVTPPPSAATPVPAPYAVPSPGAFLATPTSGAVFTGTLNVPSQTVAVGTLTAAGNPFNILDCSVVALQYVTGPVVAAPTPVFAMAFRWPTPGTISVAFFATQTANIDVTSGYDDAVILHEVGHLVEGQYSFPTTPGGAWTFGQSDLDPRLAWSEGWATYFGAAAMLSASNASTYTQPGIYLDTLPTTVPGAVVIGLRAQLENFQPFNSATPGPNRTAGEVDALAVSGILWDVIDRALTPGNLGVDDDPLDGLTGAAGTPFPAGNGDREVFRLFAGPMSNPAIVSTTLATFWDAWLFNVLPPALLNAFTTVCAQVGVRFTTDVFEPNHTPATAAPIVPSNNWITGLTSYSGLQTSVVPNVLERDIDYYSFNLVAGTTFLAETRYPGNAVDAETMEDTFINVFAPPGGGSYGGGVETGGPGRNAAFTTPLLASVSGTYSVGVVNGGSTIVIPGRRYGGYELRVRLVSVNTAPVINSAVANFPLVSTLPSVPLSLTAAATDAEGHAITYEWRRVGNPAIIATGAVFTPVLSGYTTDTTENFEVTAVDSLGAPSVPSVVVVRIVPVGQVFWTGSLSIGSLSAVNLSAPAGFNFVIGLDVAQLTTPISYPGVFGLLWLNPATVFLWAQGVVGPSGIASSPVLIPNDPNLIGVPIYWQGLYGSRGASAIYTFSSLLTVAATP